MGFIDSRQPLYEIKANLFKGLSHPYRIRILEILAAESELPVSALLNHAELEASHLSQHLAVLRKYELVRSERRGSAVYYRIAFPEVVQLLATARTLLEQLVARRGADTARLHELPDVAGSKDLP